MKTPAVALKQQHDLSVALYDAIVSRVIPFYLLGHKFGLLQLEVLSSLDVLRNPGSSSKFT